MATVPLKCEPELLLRLRLRQVCEKYKIIKAQKQQLEKEIDELVSKKIIHIEQDDIVRLIRETIEQFGSNIDLK